MTNNQIEEFIGLFESAKKIDKDYQKYVTMSLEIKLDVDGELRNVFDRCLFRAYELYKDIKGKKELFQNQEQSINDLSEYLSWNLFVSEPWKKYMNGETINIKDVIDVARNKDNHPIKHDKTNLFILYMQCINDGHITFIVKMIENIMISKLNELTASDKKKIIASDPNNIIWLENQKEFARPFYKYLQKLILPQYHSHLENLDELLNF